MRLIDADALMKTLGITDMDCGKCAWRDKEWNLCNRGSDFEDACCAIENAPTIEKRKWIPCGERLPEFRHVINPDPEEDSGWDESPFVLVCFDDGDIECRQFIREDGMVSIYPEEFRGRKATAWMPLPEPYREEATDETP